MKIAIDALAAKIGSELTFFHNFFPSLAAQDISNEYCIILGEWQTDLLAATPERFKKRVIKNVFHSLLGRVFWEQFILPFYLRDWKIDVLYSPWNITTLFAGCTIIMVITNSNPFSSMSINWTIRQKMKQFLVRMFSILSIRKANKVIFISDNSRDLICRRYSIPLYKTDVIHYGWSSFNSDVDGCFPEFSKYVLNVSSILPHKNIEILMKAFDILVEQDGFSGALVIVGPIISNSYYSQLLSLRETIAHGDQIFFIGKVSQEELVFLYRHARILTFPSLQETFGLPLLEAMGCGIPIAASDCNLAVDAKNYFNPCREICGDVADYFNPFDKVSIFESMQRLLRDESYRNHKVALGFEKIKLFLWDSIAKQTISVIEEFK